MGFFDSIPKQHAGGTGIDGRVCIIGTCSLVGQGIEEN